MKTASLAVLRGSFIALGMALLVTVFGLLASAISRLDDQRALRHRMVAERVFDEAEREISSLLQHEAERTSGAYDAEDTDPARWSPFVVGYYRREPELRLIAEARIGPARSARVRAALAAVQRELDAAASSPVQPSAPLGRDENHDLSAQPTSPDVLRQLNRSVKVRERRQHDFASAFTVASVDRDTLVIERQAPGGTRREGFVLDVPELVSTIQSWVLSAQGLDRVASFGTSGAPKQLHGDYWFEHRLAAPLDSQRVSLRLSQLDDDDAQGTLYGLAALFAFAAVAGLVAIYRMVAVQLRFAERRNNFVAAVTHELKTPLTSIRMYGEMLRDGMVADEATRQEYYATITAEGERLTRLINNVLEHAKLQKSPRLPHVEPHDVAAIVGEVVEHMKPHIEHEGFTVSLDAPAELPRALLDADAFKQVLFNVLDNALKYGQGAAPKRIDVVCRAAGQGVLVSVRDYGPGVAAAQLDAIFEPFFRGGDELTRKQTGTGIGLSLVRDLVERMNGQVRGENREPGFELQIALARA